MVFIEIVMGLCSIYLLLVVRAIMSRRKNEPPGPFPYPLIGNLIQVAWLDSKYPHVALTKMQAKYGDIFSVKTGVVKAVCISGYTAIKKVLSNDEWNGRPDFHWMLDRTYEQPLGIIFSDVEHWRECRKTTTRLLRDFGFGKKKSMEEMMIEEFEEFCKYMMSVVEKNGGVVHMNHIFSCYMVNNIWTMASGQRIMAHDERSTKLVRLMYDWIKHASYANNSLIGAYPFLSKLAPKLVSFDKIHDINIQMQTYFEEIIVEHRGRGGYKTNPQNFIEAYLKLIDEAEENGSTGNVYTEKTLVSILYDFFLAASDTSSNTLSFGILFFILYPDVQRRIREEIDSVLGPNTLPKYEDKEKLPYTEATLLEIFRISDVLPIGPRKVYQDTKYDDYVIPKGTTIMLNYHSVCFDKNTWVEPQKFNPERFLSAEGNKVMNADKLLTFSAGKRNCIGELVARMTTWIFLTGLVQRYAFEKVPGAILPNPLLPISGLTNSPAKYEVLVKTRKF